MQTVTENTSDQAAQTKLCVNKMEDFSDEINAVYCASESMTQTIQTALSSVLTGKTGIDKLSIKSKLVNSAKNFVLSSYGIHGIYSKFVKKALSCRIY